MTLKSLRRRGGRARKYCAVAMAIAMLTSTGFPTVVPVVQAQSAPVGAGFELNAGDLRFILTQIQIAEAHSRGADLRTLLPDVRVPFGLRTVDGSYNHLMPGQTLYGAADQVFPRMTEPQFRSAETVQFDFDGPGPLTVGTPTSYTQKKGDVYDSQPRVASNLIVDQTATNPAAVAAAGNPPIVEPSGTLYIQNTATDAGLSAPFNSMFTFFGQFFDHGLDLVTKGPAHVYIPLRDDDPLVAGPDKQFGTADDLAPNRRFMPFVRATNQPGPDGILGDNPTTANVDESADDVQEATNTTTPFVDQNQTYTSHPSHQVFLRQYVMVNGRPVATGRLIDGLGGAIANWNEVKAQAAAMLGIGLVDSDIFSVPQLVTDLYGRFQRGANGFPLLVLQNGSTVEGNPQQPVSTVGARKTGHAFLDDIAHNAVPSPGLAPDGDTAVNSIFAPRPAGTYDNELLGRHFITGDGRGNENVALTAVHTIFHSEHNRLAPYIENLINTAPDVTPAERAAWFADNSGLSPQGWNFGERLFQAARFVTEMQYQHLVFEEFARKVQPAINPFIGDGINFVSDINPAITAEFAHTVYRFGHSMLRDVVARLDPETGDPSDIPLIQAFLNPLAFDDNRALTAAEAAGRVFQGSTRQAGNEIDEFITEALRNNLLGLPLDLASINLARGRSEGIPPLNVARRTFYQASADSALAPYANWQEFGMAIKHPESLVNFIAAYGVHPTVNDAGPDSAFGTADDVTTLEAKRAAAEALLTDNSFMLQDASTSGVDRIDYWVGGLAEKQNPFGGLLGSTFNYVFETQLENLQNADRFYYLERLDGLNLLSQLEGNSFSELIMRNTSARGLPADVFSRPDLLLNLSNLANGLTGIQDDPTTQDFDETTISELSRRGDGAWIYAGGAHVLWNGSAGADIVLSSEGDDTIQGFGGNDRLEGASGNDQILGGDGDDIILDTFGDDVLKGGPGNDAISGGPGLDLLQGNAGNDFIVAGIDLTENFGGPGNDIIYMGKGLSESIGGAGDDWMEGTDSPASIAIGDDNNQFQNDPNGGHDILLAGPGDMDFDSEGGDDIMVGSVLPTHRFEGMLGFDLVTYRGDPLPVDADMSLVGIALPPTPNELRDRFDLTEALSGWNQNDILRGDARLDVDMIGHELTKEGAQRVTGLSEFLQRMTGVVVGLLQAGATAFTGGNIIMGGLGSDVIEGRQGNDLIDGDAWLNVQLRAPNPATADPADSKLVDSLQQIKTEVFAGLINPGQISFVRSIVAPGLPVPPGAPTPTVPAPDCGTANPRNCDTAVFSGNQGEYTISRNAAGAIIVDHNGGVDGVDILMNIEQLRFADVMIPAPPAGNLALSSVTPVENQALTVSVSGLATTPVSQTFAWQAEANAVWTQVATGTSFTPGDPVVGQRLRVVFTFTGSNGVTQTLFSNPTAAVLNVNDVPSGLPTITPTTTPQVGTAVFANTANVADGDGVGPFTYQWLANNLPIVGATAPSFIPTTAQLGQTLRVAVRYVDLHGTAEGPLTSAATAAVIGAPAGGGGGTAGAVVSIPTTLDFGAKRLNTTTIRRVDVTNTGTANLSITGVTPSGAGFSATIGTCGVSLAPGRRCRIDVTFVPTAPTLYNGTVTITSNATNNPTVMTLTGSGR